MSTFCEGGVAMSREEIFGSPSKSVDNFLSRDQKDFNPARATFLSFFNSISQKFPSENSFTTLPVFDLEQQHDQTMQIGATEHSASQPDNKLFETGKAFDLWIRHCTAELIKQGIYDSELSTSGAPVDTNDNKIILWRLADFQAIRAIKQSHYMSRNWAVNVLREFVMPTQITIPSPNNRHITITDQKVISDMLVSLISRIFKAFDPIAIAERQFHAGEIISFQRCLINVIQNYANSEFKIPAETRDYEKKRIAKKNKDKANDVSELWQYIDSLDTLEALIQVLHLMLSSSPQNNIDERLIVNAAQASNRKIAEIIAENFSLDYEEFSYNLLLSFFKEHQMTDERESVSELYQMILNNTLFDHKEHALELIRAMQSPERSIFNTLPLHWAAVCGNTPVVEWLLSNSEAATVKWVGDITETADGMILPIHLAIRHCKYHGNNLQLLNLLCNEDIIDTKTENDLSLFDMIINELDDPLPVLSSFLDKYEEEMSIDPDNLEKDLSELIIEALEEGYDDVACFLREYLDEEMSLISEENVATSPDDNDELIECAEENDPEITENFQAILNTEDEAEETLSDMNEEFDSDDTESLSERECNDDDFVKDADEEDERDELSDEFDYDSEAEFEHDIELSTDDNIDSDEDHEAKESSDLSEIEPTSLRSRDADTKTESIASLLALMNINAEERRSKQSQSDSEIATDVAQDNQCDNAVDNDLDIHDKQTAPDVNLDVELEQENPMLDEFASVTRCRY